MSVPPPVPLARQTDDFVVGTLYYNGVNFPPARKMTASYEPVYDSSKRVVKYVQGSVTVECMMYPGFLDDPVSFPGGGGEFALPYYRPDTVSAITKSGKDATTDTTLNEIRHRLMQPCQWLKIDSQGFGTVNLNCPTTSSPKDVNAGPKPKVLKWTPYTNKMALVQWTVEFCFSPCDDPTTGSHRYSHNTCEFSFDVSIEIDERGLSTRTNNGKYEIPLTRKPTSNASPGPSQDFNMLEIEKRILTFFPRVNGFKRVKQSFTMSTDRKFVNFQIVDSEINSMDAYGEGIAHADVKVTTSSSYKEGGYFTRWSTTLDGTLLLIPGYSKVYAWKEIVRLYDRYCISVANKGVSPPKQKDTKYDLQALTSQSGGDPSKSRAILISTKFVDNVFDRSVQFSYTWDLYTTTASLFNATGIFSPIDETHNDRFRRWERWRANTSVIYDQGGFQNLTFTNPYDIVVGLCDPWMGFNPGQYQSSPMPETSDPPGSNKKVRPKKFEIEGPTAPTTEEAFYSTFQNVFVITTDAGSFGHIPVYALPMIQEKAPSFARMLDGNSKPQSIHTEGTEIKSAPPPKPIHHRVRPPRTHITMMGYAERLGAPPQIPFVESIDDEPAFRVGYDKVAHIDRGLGVDMISGKQYSIHGTYWQKTYCVAGYPENNIIKSDGHKAGIYQA